MGNRFFLITMTCFTQPEKTAEVFVITIGHLAILAASVLSIIQNDQISWYKVVAPIASYIFYLVALCFRKHSAVKIIIWIHAICVATCFGLVAYFLEEDLSETKVQVKDINIVLFSFILITCQATVYCFASLFQEPRGESQN